MACILALQTLRALLAPRLARKLCAPSLLERVRAIRALDDGARPPHPRASASDLRPQRREAVRPEVIRAVREDTPPTSDAPTYATLPLHLRPYAADVERYIVHAWVQQYPLGARLRKLQRDIAFRMPWPAGDGLGKMDVDELKQFVCLLADRGLVDVVESVEANGSPKTIVMRARPSTTPAAGRRAGGLAGWRRRAGVGGLAASLHHETTRDYDAAAPT